MQLHSHSGDRDGWGKGSPDAIRALPFARTFVRHADGVLPDAPVVRAVDSVRCGRADSALARNTFAIARAILHGATDRETVRAQLRLSEFTFTVSVLNALRALKAATEREGRAPPRASSA